MVNIPCFTGLYITTTYQDITYYSATWFQSLFYWIMYYYGTVFVEMDLKTVVSILILLDYVLLLKSLFSTTATIDSCNPYFTGLCITTDKEFKDFI
mgnify:CR=1 FL=1